MDTVFLDNNLDQVLAAVRDTRLLSLDLETTGLNPIDSRILLCQIGAGDTAFVIDARKLSLGPLIPYLSDPAWKTIIHQSKFEQSFIQHFYKQPIRGVFDTMTSESVLDPDLKGRVSLQTVTGKYLGRVLNKEIRSTFFNMPDSREFTQEQIDYAAEDADVLPGIMYSQIDELTEKNLIEIAQLESDVASVTASMELTGVPIDKGAWNSKVTEYRGRHEESRLKMHELLFDSGKLQEQTAMFVRDSINLDSQPKLIVAFEKLGIKIPLTKDKKTGTMKKSLDERSLYQIDHDVARELINYRGFAKILSSYDESFLDKIHPFDNRIHAEFNQLGTETGRYSCEKPNLQQLPADFRKCVADPNFQVISADYSNIELRILAHLSGDKAFASAFDNDGDPHKATAAMMFNIPQDIVTKEQRFIAKTINFGISYGMGPGKLRDTLNEGKKGRDRLTYPQVKELHQKYKKIYITAMTWLEDAGKSGFRNAYSTTIMGRKRFYHRPNPDEMDQDTYEGQLAGLLRQAANSPIQGSNADITKMAMISLEDRLRDEGWKANIIIQVHDEIVLLAHKAQAETVKNIVVEEMINAATSLIKDVPIKVEATVSDNWNK